MIAASSVSVTASRAVLVSSRKRCSLVASAMRARSRTINEPVMSANMPTVSISLAAQSRGAVQASMPRKPQSAPPTKTGVSRHDCVP